MRLVTVLVLGSSAMWGQYGGGTLLGTITDPTGGVVPGAKVVAVNRATNETREFTSDETAATSSTRCLPVRIG